MCLNLGTFSWAIANWVVHSVLLQLTVPELSGKGQEWEPNPSGLSVLLGFIWHAGSRVTIELPRHSLLSPAHLLPWVSDKTDVHIQNCSVDFHPGEWDVHLQGELHCLARWLKQAGRSIWFSPLAMTATRKLKHRCLYRQNLGDVNPPLPWYNSTV